jgi:hypothetical protein
MTEEPRTADIRFTSHDVGELLAALSNIAPNLPTEQWRLLLSIIAVGAGRIEVIEHRTKGILPEAKVKGSRVIEDPKNKDTKVLLNQLRNAYIPCQPEFPNLDMVIPPDPGGGTPPPAAHR